MSVSAPRRLVVNADDFGLTLGVSRGIVRGHLDGIVTSTTVLAVAPAFEASMELLRDAPDLGVGVHLCLVGEDPPLSPPASIPSLVDRDGRLPLTWRGFVARAATFRVDAADVERELSAQVERVLSTGVTVTHLDSHQHLHLFPIVRDVALRLAARHRIPGIRIPRSRGTRPAGHAVNVLAWQLERRARKAGLVFPDAAAGFDEAGDVDLFRFLGVLRALAATPAQRLEIGVHPGEGDDPARARYAWSYRWEDELRAMLDPRARDLVKDLGLCLSTYADF